jgi:hypothetical protein
MTSLVVPGVRVEARFDVLPPLPAPAGIIGIVGVVDRPVTPPRLLAVTKPVEVAQLLGPGTEVSMPEVMHALANGAAEVVVADVQGGSHARLQLPNANTSPAVLLRSRSRGAWSPPLHVDVKAIRNAAGDTVRISLRILRGGRVVEHWDDLVVDPGQPGDLFDTINTQSRYVVAVDPGFAGERPAAGTYALAADGTPVAVPVAGETTTLFTLAPAASADPTNVTVVISGGSADDVTVRVLRGGAEVERFGGLSMDPDSADHLPTALLSRSSLVVARPASSLPAGERLPAQTTEPLPFDNGSSPNVAAYRTAIDLLAEDPRIDLVVASMGAGRPDGEVHQIHQALVAHAVARADAGAPRIAIGSVTANEQADLDRIRDHAAQVRHRRFVLVAPPGAAGAVAGMVGRLTPELSPTFKPVPLHGVAAATYREGQLNRLLGSTHNVVVVQQRANRGVVVLRGIDTTGDQISVTRVADACIRETKAIAENFIGRLNTDESRAALREQIVATFTRMERAGWLVPSTDGEDPAFIVDVYSTQQDFAQGIVRIDIAVRPVRAIDFIYATIRVKN